jgi:hypothetical protein
LCCFCVLPLGIESSHYITILIVSQTATGVFEYMYYSWTAKDR